MTRTTTPSDSPLARFERLIAEQGRTRQWVAAQAGMSPQTLSKRVRARRGNAWRPGEREAIARAFGVPVGMIWPPGD